MPRGGSLAIWRVTPESTSVEQTVVVLNVINALRLMAGDDDAHAALHHRMGGVRGEVEAGDALGGGVDHLLAVGGVAVLVEVQAGAAWFVGEADDAMAGIGIDPAPRGIGGGGEKRKARQQSNQSGGAIQRHLLAGYHRRIISPDR